MFERHAQRPLRARRSASRPRPLGGRRGRRPATPPTAAPPRQAWQSASARASAASAGCGSASSRRMRATIVCTCALVGRAVAGDGRLHLGRRVGRGGQPALGRQQQRDAARLRRAHDRAACCAARTRARPRRRAGACSSITARSPAAIAASRSSSRGIRRRSGSPRRARASPAVRCDIHDADAAPGQARVDAAGRAGAGGHSPTLRRRVSASANGAPAVSPRRRRFRAPPARRR